MDRLNSSIQYIKGVGPKKAYRLNRLNVFTILDFIYFFPRDYEDRSNIKTLRDGVKNEKITLEIEISGFGMVSRPRRGLSILKIPFKESTGFGYLVFFNQDYLKDKYKPGDRLVVNGKYNRAGMESQIVSPVCESPDTNSKVGRIVPLYHLTEGLTNNDIIKIVSDLLNENILYIQEALPKYLLEKYNLMDVKEALYNIHFPKTMDQLNRARKRLVYEELLTLQLGLFMIKNKSKNNNQGIVFSHKEEVAEFIQDLPFKLTNAQMNVIREISDDMESDKQMNRLVQGDVGSGKTIVGFTAMYKAVVSGYQSAMMAPTEILAAQHYESLARIFSKYGINCRLLVGSLSKKEKDEILAELKSGEIDIIVGTHAIIQDNVEFHRLGLVITDEQHRFGVKQRAVLTRKGENPDILVMTATPIPRTLALILYGDLDISIIDELPPGRKEIETYAVDEKMKERIYRFMENQIKEGRQVYIVCPLIEQSESLSVNSAEELYTFFKDDIFKSYNVGLLHGKMSPKEKDDIMNSFKDNKIQMLVSTTVIEVGVNVPNANTMVVFNAERFGLAQLHQLRGRVGRGEYQSYCILINESMNPISRERMRILQASSDGFIISEKDLQLRGPGEFFGTKQHGLPELKIANLLSDIQIMKVAQKDAEEIINQDSDLNKEDYLILKQKINEMFKKNQEVLDY